MMDFDKVLKKTNYTLTQLRKRIEDTFKSSGKKLGDMGKTNFFNDPRRKEALLEDIGRAKEEFKELRLYSIDDSLIRFEVSCAVNFNTLEDQLSYSIASAIWILDELRRAGRLYDAFKFMPTDRSLVCDEYLPVDFYHPCYEMELIQSVLYVINPRHADQHENFRNLTSLIPKEKISAAVEKFKSLRWEAVHRYLQCEEVFDRRNEKITLELKALTTPNVLMVNKVEDPTRERELAEEGLRSEDDRKDLEIDFEGFLGTTAKRPFGSRELGRILNNFPIDNPYEICFAASCLLNEVDDVLWATKSCVAVVSAAGRLLPWYITDWDDEDYWEPMSFDLNSNWLERSSPEPDLEKMFKPGADGLNMSQRIYKLSRGVLPVGFHPFEGEGNDAAELLFLSSFRARAGNLRTANRWWDGEDADADEEVEAEEADAEPITLGGYWGKVANELSPASSNPLVEEKEEAPDLTADLEKARKEIKNLRRALAELSQEAEADKARADHELKSLRMEHRELADLRSLVFNINTADPARVEKTTRQISYPYSTRKRTVVFGGHDSFLRAFKPMLPDVKFVDTEQYGFAPEIVRNADVVWVQTNCISHSQYNNVTKVARQYGIQMRYFGYASAEKCAEQLVTEDEKA